MTLSDHRDAIDAVGPHDLLTASEVAAMLRVTPGWVYAATRHDSIPHVRLGRYVRYRRAAIVEWLDANERAGHRTA